MAERKGGNEALNKVEGAGAVALVLGVLFEFNLLGVVGALTVAGAEGYKYYQKNKK